MSTTRIIHLISTTSPTCRKKKHLKIYWLNKHQGQRKKKKFKHQGIKEFLDLLVRMRWHGNSGAEIDSKAFHRTSMQMIHVPPPCVIYKLPKAVQPRLYNWRTDPCYLIGETHITWHSSLFLFSLGLKKSHLPMVNGIYCSTVWIILVSQAFEIILFYFLNKSNDKDLYISCVKQILSGLKLWNGKNIIARWKLDFPISWGSNIPPFWATRYLYTSQKNITWPVVAIWRADSSVIAGWGLHVTGVKATFVPVLSSSFKVGDPGTRGWI